MGKELLMLMPRRKKRANFDTDRLGPEDALFVS